MLRPDRLSLHAAAADLSLCASIDLPADGAPEWVHLLPAGEIATLDGRGPYRVADMAALARLSLEQAGGKLPIDENHATDLAAPRGGPAPARGWIVALQAGADGLWGEVEWTEEGKRLVASRAYRGISPAIRHRPDGQVLAVLRASLVNNPNLRGLAALHALNPAQEPTMLETIAKALGLAATATEAEITAAATALHAEQTKARAALDPIALAAGLKTGADAAAVLVGVQQLAQGGDAKAITGLQAELTAVTTRLNTLLDGNKRKDAETFVDAAIKAGRVGVKPMRDRYVTLHMADPKGIEELIGAMPILGGGNTIVPATPPARDGEIALNAEQLMVARMLGQDPKDYAATLKAEQDAAL